MPFQRALKAALVTVALGVASAVFGAGSAAASETCAATTSTATAAVPTTGNPCWVDVTPYPFGSDGGPVDPRSAACVGSGSGASDEYGPAAYGPSWQGDYAPGANGQPPCYEQVTSLAFRAPNRGLAATQLVDSGNQSEDNPYGVWLYNGAVWFPDPTFPGSNSCPGSTILWAGKLDYWLIGGTSPGTGSTILCHFDGVNLDWEILSLPAAAIDQLPVVASDNTVSREGGITSGTCLSYDDCWFLGTDGIIVHWDGQELTDQNYDLGASPWLSASFTAAASAVSPSGEEFGLAFDSGLSQDAAAQIEPVPAAPDGTAAPLAYGLSDAGLSPLPFRPPAASGGAVSQPEVAAMNDNGAAWVAILPGYPSDLAGSAAQPAPLLALNSDGSEESCAGPDSFTYSGASGYDWGSLAVASDDSAYVGGRYSDPAVSFGSSITADQETADREPVIVHAACGTIPTIANGGITEFRIPDPTVTDQAAAPLVPADWGASMAAVSVGAGNDAWAAAGSGSLELKNSSAANPPQRPHLYQYTDGQPPDAPAGDDVENRPSLFTLSPPEYIVTSPTVVVQSVANTVTKTKAARKVKRPAAVYALQTKVSHLAGDSYQLSLSFKVRRTVTIGLAALHGQRVVARTGLKRFKPGRGQLTVPITTSAWPTGLKLLS